MDPTTVPFTAWQQAVFVVLFLMAIGLILNWVARENKQLREFQRTEAQARENAQAERDKQWRDFLRAQAEAETTSQAAVKESLDALVAVTKSLVEEVHHQRTEFQVHDQKEWARLDEMAARIKTRRRNDSPPTPKEGEA